VQYIAIIRIVQPTAVKAQPGRLKRMHVLQTQRITVKTKIQFVGQNLRAQERDPKKGSNKSHP
jgi:hypothetical protein